MITDDKVRQEQRIKIVKYAGISSIVAFNIGLLLALLGLGEIIIYAELAIVGAVVMIRVVAPFLLKRFIHGQPPTKGERRPEE